MARPVIVPAQVADRGDGLHFFFSHLVKGFTPQPAHIIEVDLMPGVFLGQLEFDGHGRFFHAQQQGRQGLPHLEIIGAVLDLQNHVAVERAVQGLI